MRILEPHLRQRRLGDRPRARARRRGRRRGRPRPQLGRLGPDQGPGREVVRREERQPQGQGHQGVLARAPCRRSRPWSRTRASPRPSEAVPPTVDQVGPLHHHAALRRQRRGGRLGRSSRSGRASTTRRSTPTSPVATMGDLMLRWSPDPGRHRQRRHAGDRARGLLGGQPDRPAARRLRLRLREAARLGGLRRSAHLHRLTVPDRRGRRDPGPAAARPVPGGGAVRRRRRAGRARRPLRGPASCTGGPGGLRPARHPRRAGHAGDHRGHRGRPLLARRRGRGARAVAGPGRAAVPVRRAGRLRWLRLPARVARRASGCSRPRWSASSSPGSPGSTSTVTVEAVPGDQDGLRWRTRQRFVPLPDGRHGMRKHRSHDVVPVDDCLIAGAAPSHLVRGVPFEVAAETGFWQVHPGAPETLVDDRARDARAAAGGVGARPLRRRRPVRPLPRRRRRPVRGGHRWSRGTPRRAGTRPPTCRERTCVPATSAGCCAADVRRRRSTSWCSTRRGPVRSGPSWSRSSPGGPARWRTSPATRRRWRATSRSSPSTATGSACSARSTRSR